MSDSPLFFATPRTEPFSFVPGFSTRPRILFTPGASGSRIHAINVASSAAGAKKLQLGVARRITAGSGMGTGHFTDGGAGSDSIARSTGSFVTDGWRVGERMMAQGATTLANDFLATLTAVAALSLTFATATVSADEDFATATALYRLALMGYIDVPAGAGKPSAVAVSALDTTQMPMLDASPDRQLTLGPNDLLVGYLDVTLSTGETLDVNTLAYDY